MNAPKHPLQNQLAKTDGINTLRQLPITNYSDYHNDFKQSLTTKINPLIDELDFGEFSIRIEFVSHLLYAK